MSEGGTRVHGAGVGSKYDQMLRWVSMPDWAQNT